MEDLWKIYKTILARVNRAKNLAHRRNAELVSTAMSKVIENPTIATALYFSKVEREYFTYDYTRYTSSYSEKIISAISKNKYVTNKPLFNTYALATAAPSKGAIYFGCSYRRPGQLKIGYTTITLKKREALFRAKFPEKDFQIVGHAVTAFPSKLESLVFQELRELRISHNQSGVSNEWFRCDPEKVKQLIEDLAKRNGLKIYSKSWAKLSKFHLVTESAADQMCGKIDLNSPRTDFLAATSAPEISGKSSGVLDADPSGSHRHKWSNGDEYEGDWGNGKPSGIGSLRYASGEGYSGGFLHGQFFGYGTFEWSDGTRYVGEWRGGKQHGKGVVSDSKGNQLAGVWLNGKRVEEKSVPSGSYRHEWSNGDEYEGDWRNGKPSGIGSLRYASGEGYSGGFLRGQFFGYGTFVWSDGTRYVGEWRGGKQHGKGVSSDSKGNQLAGVWLDGKRVEGKSHARKGKSAVNIFSFVKRVSKKEWELKVDALRHKESGEIFRVRRDDVAPLVNEVVEGAWGYQFHVTSRYVQVNYENVENVDGPSASLKYNQLILPPPNRSPSSTRGGKQSARKRR